jgi:hypothetical protein
MEIMGNSSLGKKQLIEASAYHKKELEDKVKSISQNTEKMLTNALVIGGALALTYFVVTSLTDAKSKKKKAKRNEAGEEAQTEVEHSTPTVLSQIGDMVITQATMTLLEFGKEKLAEYLHSRKASDEIS